MLRNFSARWTKEAAARQTEFKTALCILRHMIADIEAERREWEFSALSPQEQAKERERLEKANREWKEKIAEIKRRHDIIEADAPQEEEIT